MLRLKEERITPPGGWFFVELLTGQKFKAETLPDLVKQIVKYRESNDIAGGAPEDDVHEFLCARMPELCGRPHLAVTFESFTMEDVKAFLAFFKDAVTQYGYAPLELAEARAAVCVTCPLNVRIPGCKGCHSIASLIVTATGGKRTKYDSSLQECGACGCALSAKVNTPSEIVEREAARHTYPAHCWITNESKTL